MLTDKGFLSGDGYAHETVTIEGTSKGLTTATWQPTATDTGHVIAFITNRGSAISYTYDGTTVTTTVGHIMNNGDQIKVEGHHNITNFKAIRLGGDSPSNGTLDVTYERKPS